MALSLLMRISAGSWVTGNNIMAKKIKKKAVQKKRMDMHDNERTAVFAAVAVVIIVDVLLFLMAFPMMDASMPVTEDYGSGGIMVFKIIVVMVVDIALFIPIYMALSRRSKTDRKK